MALANPIWSIDHNNDVALNPAYYLRSELGVALRAMQDENTIEAIKTPETFIKKRSDNIADLFGTEDLPGPVTRAFKERYNELLALQLPEEVARTMAKRSASRVYNEQLEILELKAPDAYAKAFGIASVEHNATIAKNEVAGGLGEDQFDDC